MINREKLHGLELFCHEYIHTRTHPQSPFTPTHVKADSAKLVILALQSSMTFCTLIRLWYNCSFMVPMYVDGYKRFTKF